FQKVLGVIIGKTDVRSFPDRKNVEINRFTFGFTIRDSPDFFINVTAWGTEAYINGLADSFSIGDCVTIESPLVSTKDPEKGDRFCPTTPSLYRLLVTETHSQVCLCADGDASDWLLPLLHLPVKDSRDFYSLGDVVANGQKLEGSVINILAALKQVGDVKQFVTSDGRRGQRLEVKLFDDSVSSFPLISWDREPIQLLQGLLPRETGRLESISDVYTVSQLKEKAKEHPQPFFGLTYSFISRLDLDSSVSKVIKTRCGRCRLLVTEDLQTCSNQLCPARDQPLSASTGFDLLVDFTDHTGTLQACSLRGPVAEQTLGCTTEEFTRLTDDQRTALKWRFLLERCKIHVKIVPCARTKSGIRALVLGCLLADPGEVKQHMAQLLQGP
uniref:Meiosis specific with OB-fold n=1 Tax=Fundulus heteroclitus TaxID=8078 RepID=A0A3Q2QS81_FUNHE